jgi:hypothetical protein
VSASAIGAEALRLREDHVLVRVQRGALVAGLAGVALCAAGAALGREQFLRSYLVAYLFWCGIGLGCLAILMVQYLTGGAWGAVARRVLESGTRTLPLMAVLFVPLALGLGDLYEWARPEAVARDPVLQHKSSYLNVPFFLGRAAFYFAVWIALARLLVRWSLEQDRAGDPALAARLEMLSRGGLVLYGLTMTFAAIDWAMSLEPHWFSTIYGVIFMGGQGLSTFAFVIPVLALVADRPPLSHVISADRFHDLGKLMLAFVMLWAYFALSQFLITWAANLPEEIPWYLRRTRGGWWWLGLGLIVFHFVLPFVILLSRDVKRKAGAVAAVAGVLILVRFVDLFWMVRPAFEPAGLTVHWLDPVTAVAIGGLWIFVFVAALKARPLLPAHDPSLAEGA